MKVFAILMVRDEADIIRYTLENLLAQDVDGILIADNNSVDGTLDILTQVQYNNRDRYIAVIPDPEVGYYQSRKMTHLAKKARFLGADWIIPCDADELWTSTNGLTVGETLRQTHAYVLEVPMLNHFCSGEDDPAEKNPFKRMAWRQITGNPLNKVAFFYREDWVIAQGNHHLNGRNGREFGTAGLPVSIRHFPYRSAEQFVRKARNGAEAYAATNLPSYEGAHWRDYGRILAEQGEAALKAVFETHFYYPQPQGQLVYDPAPYRVREVV